MADRHLAVLLLVAVGLIVPHTTYALAQKDANAIIKKCLSAQKTSRDDTDSQGSAIADLNGDGKPEIVLVWTLLGPTYWHNTLTVFAHTAKGYTPAGSIQLTGEAKLAAVKDGVILVNQTVFARGDLVCCPSLKKQVRYR
jgi:hypothetical protein